VAQEKCFFKNGKNQGFKGGNEVPINCVEHTKVFTEKNYPIPFIHDIEKF
jgi:hypothetical protein